MSPHQEATRVLKEWSAPNERQERLRRAYIEHLATYPDGLWQACGAGHLTASAIVLDPPRERVLLVLHRKLEKWLQPGGHCEPEDDSLAGAAHREATEETGIEGLRLLPGPVTLDRHHTPCAPHLDVQYAAVAPEGATAAISEESLDVRWFGYDAVAGVADESVVRLVTAARARL